MTEGNIKDNYDEFLCSLHDKDDSILVCKKMLRNPHKMVFNIYSLVPKNIDNYMEFKIGLCTILEDAKYCDYCLYGERIWYPLAVLLGKYLFKYKDEEWNIQISKMVRDEK